MELQVICFLCGVVSSVGNLVGLGLAFVAEFVHFEVWGLGARMGLQAGVGFVLGAGVGC